MKVGGGINNEGLVFGYDASGHKFGGEPTTNLVPSAEHNGQFTTSNGWSTYNTNQYNGNTYFSIGTIGSVTNNIVTLSSVGTNIRSFDVLTPQTTGGGVTAGTRYVIKKISSTEFSLHEYNSSQDGSQGYINPDTGFFKVHDAYANDTRISISASGFPTMWWGPPHLPNSGLIKEIVPNGGRRAGTNCMRLHVYRGDGVADGMAYGVYCPVTVGDIITMSVWIKLTDERNMGGTLGYSTYFNAGYSAGSTTFSNLTTEWKKYEYTWTSSNTFTFYSYWWPSGSSTPYSIDICDFQVEINKGHSTNFTTGTRSNTETLIDSGPYNFQIDTSNIQWSSVQHPHFHGASHYIDLSSNPNVGDNAATWEFIARFDVVYPTDTSVYRQLYIQESSVWVAQYVNRKVGIDIAKDNGAWFDGSGGSATGSMIGPVNSGTWYHLLFTWDGSYVRGYFNSELQFTTAVSGLTAIRSGTTPRRIGMRGGTSQPFFGDIPVLRTYSVALSQQQVIENYLAFKPRFGLS